MTGAELPDDVEYIRTTDVFDTDSVPKGLLRAHRVAAGVWGRIVVDEGSVTLVFENDGSEPAEIAAGGHGIIPPDRFHHVELSDDAKFAVEFHRAPAPD